MSQPGVGKPWTTYEDQLLTQAVSVHGENDNWKAVAASVPGRTNKACRKRWLHSLSPNVKKTAWTPEEDQLLLSLYASHGTKWSVIARNIPGRTDDACSKRYREALDPSLKRDDWTNDEDAKLIEAYSRLGGKWGLIGQELNRSGLGCRNRWRMLERRKTSHSRDSAAQSESSPIIADPATTSSRWVPGQMQDSAFWGGQSPQYVTPSALSQGSPHHSQELHGTSYSPAQILSGAHLTGLSASSSHDTSSCQLDPIRSRPSDCPNPTQVTPSHVNSRMSDFDVPGDGSEAQTSDHDFLPIDQARGDPLPETCQDDTVVPSISHVRSNDAPTTEPTVGSDSVITLESPASPSQHGSPSPPGSPVLSVIDEPVHCQEGTSPNNVTAHTRYYRTESEKAQSPTVLAPRKPANPQRATRLSSMLPASIDTNVLAYACGHCDCWPAGATNSNNAFATSRELFHHNKVDHNGDIGGSKPFRCGLTGCEKSWKSINGLQYHLQISQYHFQQALATRSSIPTENTTAPSTSDTNQTQEHPTSDLTAPIAGSEVGTTDSCTAAVPDHSQLRPPRAEKGKRKSYPCPHAGCDKHYKQLSGLRYHLTHGHIDTLPLQLEEVPPTLARIIAEKAAVQKD